MRAKRESRESNYSPNEWISRTIFVVGVKGNENILNKLMRAWDI